MAVRLLFRNHSKRRRNDNVFQKWGQGRVIDIKNNITTTSIKGARAPPKWNPGCERLHWTPWNLDLWFLEQVIDYVLNNHRFTLRQVVLKWKSASATGEDVLFVWFLVNKTAVFGFAFSDQIFVYLHTADRSCVPTLFRLACPRTVATPIGIPPP